MISFHGGYQELPKDVASDEFDLTTLDQYFEEWKKKAASKNINIDGYTYFYLAAKAGGEALRDPKTLRLPKATFENQKKVRTMVVNNIIYRIALSEIEETEKAALADPRFKKLSSEIKDDAKYLRRMLSPKPSADEPDRLAEHPIVAESRYYRMNSELKRITEKVLDKISGV